MSKRDFWLATFPIVVGILLLTTIIILWKREWAVDLRSNPKAAIKKVCLWAVRLRSKPKAAIKEVCLWAVRLRSKPKAAIKEVWRLAWERWCRFRGETTGDVEKGSPDAGNPQERIPNGSPNPAGSLHTDGKGATTVDESPTTLPLTPTCQNTKV